MTERDTRDIHYLYYFQRYIPSSIARIYGVSVKHILHILNQKDESVSVVVDLQCNLCGLDAYETYYIDGNSENKKPQNIITLCRADQIRIRALQLRKNKSVLLPQMPT